jgi:putative flavoprotein involved in K+ transport
MGFIGVDPEAFPSKEAVADYLAAYATMVRASIRYGIDVQSVETIVGRR